MLKTSLNMLYTKSLDVENLGLQYDFHLDTYFISQSR